MAWASLAVMEKNKQMHRSIERGVKAGDVSDHKVSARGEGRRFPSAPSGHQVDRLRGNGQPYRTVSLSIVQDGERTNL